MAGYIVSGAGEAAANGEYTNRGILINGMPSYTNGTWYLYLATEIMGDPPSSTWILSVIVTASVPDFGMGSYYVFPFGGPIGTWRVGEFGTPPAPTVVAYSVEDDPTDPGDEPEPDDEPGVVDEVPYVLLGEAGYGLRVLGAGDYAALLAEGSVGVRRVAVRRTLGL
jgi:hypothetical protein